MEELQKARKRGLVFRLPHFRPRRQENKQTDLRTAQDNIRAKPLRDLVCS